MSVRSKEDIVKNATRLPFPEENALYHSEVAVQKNVLLVGKAGSGKTTLLEVIKDVNYKTSTAFSFFSSGSKDPQYLPLVVRNSSGRAYSLNFIDTPGIFEVRNSVKDTRPNEAIAKSILDCVTYSVTSLSAVLFVLPLNLVINEEDIMALTVLKSMLGDAFRKNTYLVLSHADCHQLTTLNERITEFLSSELSLPFLDFCRGGVHFTGATDGELSVELGKNYENIAKSKVTCLRQNLLEAIISKEDIKLDFGMREEDKKKSSSSSSKK